MIPFVMCTYVLGGIPECKAVDGHEAPETIKGMRTEVTPVKKCELAEKSCPVLDLEHDEEGNCCTLDEDDEEAEECDEYEYEEDDDAVNDEIPHDSHILEVDTKDDEDEPVDEQRKGTFSTDPQHYETR